MPTVTAEEAAETLQGAVEDALVLFEFPARKSPGETQRVLLNDSGPLTVELGRSEARTILDLKTAWEDFDRIRQGR